MMLNHDLDWNELWVCITSPKNNLLCFETKLNLTYDGHIQEIFIYNIA